MEHCLNMENIGAWFLKLQCCPRMDICSVDEDKENNKNKQTENKSDKRLTGRTSISNRQEHNGQD